MKNILFDLLARIPDLYELSDKLCIQILNNLEEKHDQFDGVNLKLIENSNQLRYNICAKETIFKVVIMISGEATKKFNLTN